MDININFEKINRNYRKNFQIIDNFYFKIKFNKKNFRKIKLKLPKNLTIIETFVLNSLK